MVPAKAGNPAGPKVGSFGFTIDSRCGSGYSEPGSGPKGNGRVAPSGTPLSPSGGTLAAEAAFTPAAVAAAIVVDKSVRLFIASSVL
ncbi:MAG TPA: hypothetical protein VKX28_25605 [Xanthobacteraceae bacterium]|jgi:hypothetical protein|nr:hypothetical protein [Xanthobacteraceae bacterium]